MAKQKTPKSAKLNVTLNLGELNPKQEQFCQSRALYTAYGGARGGGKTHAVRIKAVGGAVRWPGIRILIVRRTYPELQSNHIEPILKLVPQEIASYNGTMHTMYFTNGSTIKFGHYQGIAAETEYQGQEYDWIFMDEATQFTEREFRTLGGCLRGVNEVPKRFYITCNPGGVGHRWVKRLFIDRKFKTDSENPEENENPDDYRQAHRYGDWDALSGAYFAEFSEARHVIKPFKIPEHWRRYRSFDYGLDALACHWIAIDENGRCYVYREVKASNLIVQEAAKLIADCTLPNENILVTFAPPDMWNRQKDTGKTMAEVFMLNGINIVRSDNNRVQGHMQIKEMLADMPDGKPGLLFTNNCTEIISDIQAIQADEKNPNDCAKNPHEISHTVDSVRYFCVSRTVAAERISNAEIYEENEQLEDYDEYMTGGEINAAYINF